MTKSKQNVTEVTEVTTDDAIMSELKTLTTMSSQIRFLDSKGYSRGKISKTLSELHGKLVRYQWVRNVLITPIKKAKA